LAFAGHYYENQNAIYWPESRNGLFEDLILPGRMVWRHN